MRATRFFRILWRANAVIVFAVGVLSVFALSYVAIEIARDVTRARQTGRVVNLADQQVDRANFEIGHFQEVAGADVFRAPLLSEQEYAFAYGSKSASATRNFLFYDPNSRQVQWLVDSNDWLITEEDALVEPHGTERNRPVLAFLYQLVDKDTNDDRKLTANDLSSIALSNPKGGAFTVVKRAVDKVLGHAVMSPSSVAVFYAASGELRFLEVSLTTFDVTHDARISGLPSPKEATTTSGAGEPRSNNRSNPTVGPVTAVATDGTAAPDPRAG